VVVLAWCYTVADVLGGVVDVVVTFDVIAGPLQPLDGLLVRQRADPVTRAVVAKRLAVDIDVVSMAQISQCFAVGAVDDDVVVRHGV
jgi:hypothetical protein